MCMLIYFMIGFGMWVALCKYDDDHDGELGTWFMVTMFFALVFMWPMIVTFAWCCEQMEGEPEGLAAIDEAERPEGTHDRF